MIRLELCEIRNHICQGANLEVFPGELLVLVGSNGAGKTTLLDIIAGLVPYEGQVLFDGRSMNRVSARDRKVGYMFQDLALFPHLPVSANIAFGLQAAGWPHRQQAYRVDELVELLNISHLRNRYPAKLSGGEKQRVALARALANHPKLLLLDEPFNNLDTQASRLLKAELKQLQERLATTTILVTHDLPDAKTLADRVALMQDGLVVEIGSADRIPILHPQAPGATQIPPNVSCHFGLSAAQEQKILDISIRTRQT